ncbi:MAG: pyrimidine 5'-nucleotidase [Anaerolineales bacterium]|nr:pyrimidine 5'-nucleotidase [Anaerolineales bacterium]
MIKTIVFDLDDTLYPKGSGVMEHAGAQMIRYIERVTGLSEAASRELRASFLQRHGTTLAGLQAEYDVDREDYLRFVHAAHPREFLTRDDALAAMLARLPQRKIIFTNGPIEHAEKTLAVLGIRPHFDLLLDLRAFQWQPKPTPYPYQLLLSHLDHETEGALYIDDRLVNLDPAADLGLQTVLIGGDAPADLGRHRHVQDILELEGLL